MADPLSAAEAAERYRAVVSERLKIPADGGSGFRRVFAKCESPIEQIFCLALFQVSRVFGPGISPAEAVRIQAKLPVILVWAQEPLLNRYRLDFLLLGLSPHRSEPKFVIVECDGEDWHSTREQRRRDHGREQVLIDAGFQILRLRGMEIFREPEDIVLRALHEFKEHGWKPSDCPLGLNALIRKSVVELHEKTGELVWMPPIQRTGRRRQSLREVFESQKWNWPG